MTREPRIAIVLLTYNRPEELMRTLEHLALLPEEPQIVVVDNASRESMQQAVAARYPDVEYLRLPRNIAAAGRNEGAARVRTPYVAFCDDDTWWSPGSLRAAADILDAHPDLALLTARVLVGESQRLDPVCDEMARSPLPSSGLPGPAVLGFLACAAVVRRDAFLAAGGFEPRFFVGGEEELLALDLAAAGWRLSYVEGIKAHHHPSAQRDAASRGKHQPRNALWVAWLRRPWRVALGRTLELARSAVGDPVSRGALLLALAGLPWALRRRRRVPQRVEEDLRLLEQGEAAPDTKQTAEAGRS